MFVLPKHINSFFSMGAMENLMLYALQVLYTKQSLNRTDKISRNAP